jgi:hypothetical protein
MPDWPWGSGWKTFPSDVWSSSLIRASWKVIIVICCQYHNWLSRYSLRRAHLQECPHSLFNMLDHAYLGRKQLYYNLEKLLQYLERYNVTFTCREMIEVLSTWSSNRSLLIYLVIQSRSSKYLPQAFDWWTKSPANLSSPFLAIFEFRDLFLFLFLAGGGREKGTVLMGLP